MTVSKTAYDTVACSSYLMKKTIDAIEIAYIHGQLKRMPDSLVFLVEGGNTVLDSIPAFAHPLEFMDSEKRPCLAVDVRSFGKWDTSKNEFHIRNDIEYKLAIYRAQLSSIWINDHVAILRDISPTTMIVFASWISESVARRYSLDPREQLNLAILSAIFYNSLFTDSKELDEREKMRVATAISRNVRASSQDVLAIMDQVTVVNSLNEFCEMAAEITGSVRLKELTTGLLFSIIAGTWFGTNAKELIVVALEHPPTWMSILMLAFSERTFKNSGVTKIAERSGNKDTGNTYLRSMLNMINVTANVY